MEWAYNFFGKLFPIKLNGAEGDNIFKAKGLDLERLGV